MREGVRHIKVRRLVLANGDEYEDLALDVDQEQLENRMMNGLPVLANCQGKEITINAAFIVSLEREVRRLRAVK